MRIAVLGLWHLGSVTAACAAAAGHVVVAYDPDVTTVAELAAGRPPIAEPGLPDLVARGLRSGRLQFTSDLAAAVGQAEVVWICFDTPVDEDDVADSQYIERCVQSTFPYVSDGAVVLCSSQLPVGTVNALERCWRGEARGRRVSFACSPENLRLGKAIDAFMNPDRIVVGIRDDAARARLKALLTPITDRIEWMAVESAEMTKHAVNAFLATSVAFINELADLCELTGADAKDVERGLKSERRIGPAAYLSPGGAFAGGTLARDVGFLRSLGVQLRQPTPLMDGVFASNAAHALWVRRRLQLEFPTLVALKVAVWGLTYKPDTDTLRRSAAIELCRWLVGQGSDVHVHDPAAATLPSDLRVVRHDTALDAAVDARALVVGTSWPDYRQINVDRLAQLAPDLVVLDPGGFLGPTLGGDRRFRLMVVGQP